MQIIETSLAGCFEVRFQVMEDRRGTFVKTFHEQQFKEMGLETDWRESYYSVSRKDVIRGMHFQTPPHDHAKIVTSLVGDVLDVAVDLRKKSPTFGRCHSLVLSPEKGNAFYLPAGIGHGFLSLSDETVMLYNVSTVYAPESDTGVLWSSLPFDWPVENPVVSQRDQGFVPLSQFETPFL